MKALIVEDEQEISADICRALQSIGFVTEACHDGEEAWFKGSTENYALIVLDIGLPRMDGISILKNWRREKIATPVIILTARGNWTERVEGIDSGADDYLAKPFHMEELVARARALVRRSAGITQAVFTIGDVKVDTNSGLVLRNGIKVDLGPLEFRLLSHLMMNKSRAVPQTELLEAIYGVNGEPDSNAVEALVRRLRKKVGENLIQTRRGFGYVIESDAA